MLKTSFSRFRLISFIEGLSYLILVFIAMPMKYLADNPYLVKVVGMAHGVLFILFCIALFHVMFKCKWDKGLGFQLFVYSLIPFGFIIIEKAIKNQTKD
jgi:integral membrane protein